MAAREPAESSFKIDPGWRAFFFFYHHEMLLNKVDGMITRPRLSRRERYYDINAQENYFVDFKSIYEQKLGNGTQV